MVKIIVKITWSDLSRIICYNLVNRIVRVTTCRDFIYVVRLIGKFNYSKKGPKIFVRVKPNPTYRASDLLSLPMYIFIPYIVAGICKYKRILSYLIKQ